MQFTDQNFKQEVEESKDLVLVDFFAPWCGPCQMMGPIVEEVGKEYAAKGVKVGKLNIDESTIISQKYNIMSIPTLILFKNGEIAGQITGYVGKDELKELIDRNL